MLALACCQGENAVPRARSEKTRQPIDKSGTWAYIRIDVSLPTQSRGPRRLIHAPPWVRLVLGLNPLEELGRYRVTILNRDGVLGTPTVRWAWFIR